MLLAHIIEQLQDAHARLGNHPNVMLQINGVNALGNLNFYSAQRDELHLDFAKQTVYLPVTSNNTNP